MISIEIWKGIQERDEVIKELVNVCITVHDSLLSLHTCDLDVERCDDLRKQLKQAIAKAKPASGEEKNGT